MLDIQIQEIDRSISVDVLAALIRKAHTINIAKGLHYSTADINGKQLADEIKGSKCYIACIPGGRYCRNLHYK